MSDFIESKIQNNILSIKLNRPELHNAFNDEVIDSLTALFTDIDEQVRLVTITGNGKSFCAGADLNWMKSMKDFSMQENIDDSKKLARMFRTIDECPVPVLGKVNGHALGGGVGLVAVCDYVLAVNTAKFGFTEVRLGVIPAVISPYCIKKIGSSKARAYFLSGDLFNTHQALHMDLINETVPMEELEGRFSEIKKSFLRAGPQAARDAKKLIRAVESIPSQDIEEYTTSFIAAKRISDEGQEGMSALLDKRNAKWIQND